MALERQEFTAELKKHPGMDATYVIIPFSVEEVYGTKGQVKVRAAIDGVPYRGSLANMGMGCHILGVTKKIRATIGKSPGNTVRILLEKDMEERTVEISKDLAELFGKNKKAKEFFETLSYTNRKEYVRWIETAKKQETRDTRLKSTIEKLSKRLKNPSQK